MDSNVSVSSDKDIKKSKGPPKWRSTRYSLVYLISTGLMVVFFQRVSFSVAIVCMVNHTATDTQRHQHPDMFLNNFSTTPTSHSFNVSRTMTSSQTVDSAADGGDAKKCHRTDNETSSSDEDGPFLWDKNLQGLLLGALYWGYAVVQIPGSYVIQRRGARVVVGVAMLVMSAMHALCHPAAILSPWAVFTLRVVMGLCTGLVIPAMYSVFAMWSPVVERARLLSFAFAGQMLANASVFPSSALLCDSDFLGGWPAIFYVFGGVGALWSICWFFAMSNDPESHSCISSAEMDYIVTSRSAVTAQKQKLSVPWRAILTSGCFWAIAVSQFTYNWGFYLMITNLPTYMAEIMDVDIKSNGVFSMLPYICLFLVMNVTGYVSDFVTRRRYLSVAQARKLFTCVGYVIPAVLLVVMSHQGCDAVLVVVTLMVIGVGLTGLANIGGFYINPYDIAPQYATSICTATNTMATAAGIINPYVIATITKDKTEEQWQTVFYITAAIFALGTIVFCVFGRGDLQSWALPPDQETQVVADLDNDLKFSLMDDSEADTESKPCLPLRDSLDVQ